MGVPKFFKWVCQRYPLIVKNISKLKNNLPTFDNLYLDLNGVLHQFTHPSKTVDDLEDTPYNETEVFLNIFEYITMLVDLIKPQKFIFLAFDGVAPRTKMNEQRSRRFRSLVSTDKSEQREDFDSNIIS
ncbi:5'-3' exoribonuclease [Anaeramoeba flamelloides]|nr:5'-3' exoribonuclease [Anaeramoeba flamelloides]